MRQIFLDALCRLKEIHRIVVVFFNAGGDREDVGVENNIFRRETSLSEKLIGARADFELAVSSVGLPVLVKRHHHASRAIAHNLVGMAEESRLAFFEGN